VTADEFIRRMMRLHGWMQGRSRGVLDRLVEDRQVPLEDGVYRLHPSLEPLRMALRAVALADDEGELAA
jgi:hypothetical protein